MLFNSFIFLVFIAVFFYAWPLFRRYNNPRWIFLVTASFIFYGWWDWRFLFLIIFSGLVDFFAGIAIANRPERKKTWLILSLLGNLGSLAIFKYLLFALTNLNSLISFLGIDYSIPLVRLTLPIGISFYTFQSMSYTIDIYRGKMKPTYNVFHFFAYLALFPQLVAGPIIRASNLLPQLKEARKPTDMQIWEGLKLIAFGYFKKVVIADNLGIVVDRAFAQTIPNASMPYWWVVITFFAIQIYCDFSGYTDIARGIAKWMGYEFADNFNHPYTALGIRDFWRRWHISLTTWLRDYLFLPLGGAFKGTASGLKNLWITFLLAGIWHGAAWTFVIWGALHGFFITLEQLTAWHRKIKRLFAGKYLVFILTIIQVWTAWVFFRANSMKQAVEILGYMFNPGKITSFNLDGFTGFIPVIFCLAVIRELMLISGIEDRLKKNETIWKIGEIVTVAFALLGSVYLRGEVQTFIYFQF